MGRQCQNKQRRTVKHEEIVGDDCAVALIGVSLPHAPAPSVCLTDDSLSINAVAATFTVGRAH